MNTARHFVNEPPNIIIFLASNKILLTLLLFFKNLCWETKWEQLNQKEVVNEVKEKDIVISFFLILMQYSASLRYIFRSFIPLQTEKDCKSKGKEFNTLAD